MQRLLIQLGHESDQRTTCLGQFLVLKLGLSRAAAMHSTVWWLETGSRYTFEYSYPFHIFEGNEVHRIMVVHYFASEVIRRDLAVNVNLSQRLLALSVSKSPPNL